MGLDMLSMRPASIGPVKHLLRRTNLTDLAGVIAEAQAEGAQSVRPMVMSYLAGLKD